MSGEWNNGCPGSGVSEVSGNGHQREEWGRGMMGRSAIKGLMEFLKLRVAPRAENGDVAGNGC